MIQAIIFDMDGLLIDSEPLWREAELAIFTGLGLPVTLDMMPQTMGMRTDEVVSYWYKRHPWDGAPQADGTALSDVAAAIDAKVAELVREKGAAKAGVYEAIVVCQQAGLPMAIASSSSLPLITTVIEKLGIGDALSVIRTAHDETHGKPHPAVYISAAEALGVSTDHCLAFEDSVNGVLSAKAAKMKCIAVPEPEVKDDKRYGIADLVLNSLSEFDADGLASL